MAYVPKSEFDQRVSALESSAREIKESLDALVKRVEALETKPVVVTEFTAEDLGSIAKEFGDQVTKLGALVSSLSEKGLLVKIDSDPAKGSLSVSVSKLKTGSG